MAKVTNGGSFMASPASAKSTCHKLLKTIVEEQRNFTNTEAQRFNDYYQFLSKEDKKQFDSLINEMNKSSIFNIELRSQNENRKEENKQMNKNLTEFRNFLMDDTQKTYVENRAGESLLTDNTNTVPQYVAQQVVKALTEESTLFGEMQTFNVVNGELSVPKEKVANLSDLVFVGENVKLAPSAVAFDTVKIVTKRCGTAVKVSDQFMQESGVQIERYVLDLLARRLAKGLDYHTIKGAESIQGLDTLSVESDGIAEQTVAAVTSDSLIDMVVAMNPYHLQNAKFLMSRKTFASVSKLKDGQGAYLLQVSFRDEKPMYRVLGVEVQVSDSMDDDKIYLVNMMNAYAKVIRNQVRVRKVDNDEENVLSAMNLFVIDVFLGAKCVDGTAISRLKIQG